MKNIHIIATDQLKAILQCRRSMRREDAFLSFVEHKIGRVINANKNSLERVKINQNVDD